MSKFEVQTRNERGGLRFFSSLEEAMKTVERDPSIWKVSFALENGERVRLTRLNTAEGDKWIYDPIILPNG